VNLADFDAYCDEHRITDEELPAAFAECLATQTGEAVIGGPVDEPPEFIGAPE
jgi:hypothetical protein